MVLVYGLTSFDSFRSYNTLGTLPLSVQIQYSNYLIFEKFLNTSNVTCQEPIDSGLELLARTGPIQHLTTPRTVKGS